jgi:hypothetical protein
MIEFFYYGGKYLLKIFIKDISSRYLHTKDNYLESLQTILTT